MDRPIRAIRIDAERRLVEEFTLTSLADAQKTVGGNLELAYSIDDKNDLYADEEGRLKDLHHAFSFSGSEQDVFIGNGLVTGVDPESGEWTDTSLSLGKVRERVTFVGAVHSERGAFAILIST